MLHPLVSEGWPKYVESVEGEGGSVPGFVVRGVERYLNCGIPEAGFIRLRCSDCGLDRAFAFSCKGRGLCPSCGARRMHDIAHHLVERVLPDVGLPQYVLSPPTELVGLLTARGGYVEDGAGKLDFEADRRPTSPEFRALEDRVMARFSKWLRKHGYIGSEALEAEACDGWWQAAANEAALCGSATRIAG